MTAAGHSQPVHVLSVSYKHLVAQDIIQDIIGYLVTLNYTHINATSLHEG